MNTIFIPFDDERYPNLSPASVVIEILHWVRKHPAVTYTLTGEGILLNISGQFPDPIDILKKRGV